MRIETRLYERSACFLLEQGYDFRHIGSSIAFLLTFWLFACSLWAYPAVDSSLYTHCGVNILTRVHTFNGQKGKIFNPTIYSTLIIAFTHQYPLGTPFVPALKTVEAQSYIQKFPFHLMDRSRNSYGYCFLINPNFTF